MGELQDMADQVVVVGRGKVLADASVDELIARRLGRRSPVPHAGARRSGDGTATQRSAATVIDRGTLTSPGSKRSASSTSSARPASLLRGHRPAGDA